MSDLQVEHSSAFPSVMYVSYILFFCCMSDISFFFCMSPRTVYTAQVEHSSAMERAKAEHKRDAQAEREEMLADSKQALGKAASESRIAGVEP